MNPHFFTAPFYFAFIWFRVQGSRFKALVAASPPFFRRWYSRIAAFPSRGRCPAGAQFTAAVSRAHALTVLPSISYHSLAVLPYSASSRQSIPAFGRAFSKEKRILRYSPFAAALRSFDSVLIFSDKPFLRKH